MPIWVMLVDGSLLRLAIETEMDGCLAEKQTFIYHR